MPKNKNVPPSGTEPNSEKLNLNDGDLYVVTMATFDSKEVVENRTADGDPTQKCVVPDDSFAIGKRGPLLLVGSGGCFIIATSIKTKGIGVLIHETPESTTYKETFKNVERKIGRIPRNEPLIIVIDVDEVIVRASDTDPILKGDPSDIEPARERAEATRRHFEGLGFTDITLITETGAMYKDVEHNTANGSTKVIDGADRVVFDNSSTE